MNSKALLHVDDEEREVSLVYPEDADERTGKLSVFSDVAPRSWATERAMPSAGGCRIAPATSGSAGAVPARSGGPLPPVGASRRHQAAKASALGAGLRLWLAGEKAHLRTINFIASSAYPLSDRDQFDLKSASICRRTGLAHKLHRRTRPPPAPQCTALAWRGGCRGKPRSSWCSARR